MQKDMITEWLNSAGSVPLLGPDEVIRLSTIIQDQSKPKRSRDKAMWKVVRHNMRLIPGIVRKCLVGKRSLAYGKPGTEDLFQVGVLGLMQAAEKFDPKLGYAFSTYASLWVYQAVQRYLYNNISIIRIPESTRREIYHSIEKHGDVTFSNEKKSVKNRLTDAFLALHCSDLQREQNEETDRRLRYGSLSLADTIATTLSGKEYDCQIEDNFEDILKTAELTEEQEELLKIVHIDGLPMTKAAPKLGLTVDKGRKVASQAYRLLRKGMAA